MREQRTKSKEQRCLVSLSLLLVLCSVSAAAIARHPDFPPLAHTGGFGEPTCRECHQGEVLNAPGARLRIEGVPQPWRPGRAYRITVTLRRDSLARAGFELAARFLNAGILILYDSLLTAVDRDSISGISYAHHTRRGTAVARAVARWHVLWTAPLSGSGAIAFNVAALAANDDNSNLGDAVYTASATAPSRRRR